MRLGRRLQSVDVSIGIPPLSINGSFRPSTAERNAAWELLVELTSRTTVTSLRRSEGLIGEELASYEQVIELTRELLRKAGPEVADDHHDGNLTLGLIAMRVLNEVLRPAIAKWQPKLADYEALRPAGVGPLLWEQRWPDANECRLALTALRTTVRTYVDVLGRIAGTADLADAAVSLPPSHPAPRSSHKGDLPDGTPRRKMVGWFDAIEGFETLFAIRKGRRDDTLRTTNGDGRARPRNDDAFVDAKPTVDLSMSVGDVWIDYAADLGDGFDPTMAVAWHVARPLLDVPHDPDGELPAVPGGGLPRGELLILGGDEIYPYASRKRYQRQTLLPYVCARDDGTVGRVLAIPGNHDYYGGTRHFEELFVAHENDAGAFVPGHGLTLEGQEGGWESADQRHRWFSTKLPRGWWIWGLDTGLDGSIDEAQRAYFNHVVATEFSSRDQVVLCTPVPLWQLRQKFPDQYQSLREQIDGWLAPKDGSVALFVSGDSHYFAQYDDTSRTGDSQTDDVTLRAASPRAERHLTVGGGGAFLHPTHSLAERIPSERGRPEFQLKARWPSPADSRALSPHASILNDWQFLALGSIFGALFGLGSWMASNDWLRRFWGRKTDNPKPWGFSPFRYVAHVGAVWLILVVLVVVGCAMTTPNAREQFLRRGARRYGLLFGLGLGAVMFVGLANAHWLVDWRAPHRGRLVWFVALSFFMGGVLLCAYFFGVSWLCRNLRVNDNLAFSAVASTRFKHFVRFRFTGDGDLTVYVIGLDPVGRDWWDAMQRGHQLPPSDPDGVPHLHYIWGTTIASTAAPPPKPGRIAVSIATSDDIGTDTSQRESIAPMFEELVAHLLAPPAPPGAAHAALAYGGGLERELAQSLANGVGNASELGSPGADPFLVNYLAAPQWIGAARLERPGVQVERCSVSPRRLRCAPDPTNAQAEALAFTAMREQMAGECESLVVIGGRLADYSGRYPDAIDQAIESAAAGRPLYVVGGFGGAADALARHLLKGEKVAELTDAWQDAHGPAVLIDTPYRRSLEADMARFLARGDWSSVGKRNGLTKRENEALSTETDPKKIAELIRRGLSNLAATRDYAAGAGGDRETTHAKKADLRGSPVRKHRKRPGLLVVAALPLALLAAHQFGRRMPDHPTSTTGPLPPSSTSKPGGSTQPDGSNQPAGADGHTTTLSLPTTVSSIPIPQILVIVVPVPGNPAAGTSSTATVATTTLPTAAAPGSTAPGTAVPKPTTSAVPKPTSTRVAKPTTTGSQPGSQPATSISPSTPVSSSATASSSTPAPNASTSSTTVVSTVAVGPPGETATSNVPIELAGATGLFEDRNGDLYIADTNGNRVYKRIPDGSLVVIAGTGRTDRRISESGLATAVQLVHPTAVLKDDFGNIWIAENGGSVIREIDVAGMIHTKAGRPDLPVFDGNGGAVLRSINPYAMVFGRDGEIYFTDTDNHLVRRLFEGRLSIVAGSTVDGKSVPGREGRALNRPQGIAIDNTGNLYIADSANNRVVMLSALDQSLTTVAGGGTSHDDAPTPALQVSLDTPTGVAVTPDGSTAYIVGDDNRVRKLDMNMRVLTTVAGQGASGCRGEANRPEPPSCHLRTPNSLLLANDGSGLYISEYVGGRIWKLNRDATSLTVVQN